MAEYGRRDSADDAASDRPRRRDSGSGQGRSGAQRGDKRGYYNKKPRQFDNNRGNTGRPRRDDRDSGRSGGYDRRDRQAGDSTRRSFSQRDERRFEGRRGDRPSWDKRDRPSWDKGRDRGAPQGDRREGAFRPDRRGSGGSRDDWRPPRNDRRGGNRDDRGSRDNREDRGYRDDRGYRGDRGPRDGRGSRDDRQSRGHRGYREDRRSRDDDRSARGGREDRGFRGEREYRGGRDDRGFRGDREYRGGRDDRGYRGGRDDRGSRDNRDDRGYRGDRENRGGRGYRDDRGGGADRNDRRNWNSDDRGYSGGRGERRHDAPAGRRRDDFRGGREGDSRDRRSDSRGPWDTRRDNGYHGDRRDRPHRENRSRGRDEREYSSRDERRSAAREERRHDGARDDRRHDDFRAEDSRFEDRPREDFVEPQGDFDAEVPEEAAEARADQPVGGDGPEEPAVAHNADSGDIAPTERRERRWEDRAPSSKRDARTKNKAPLDDQSLAKELLEAPELPEDIDFADLDEEARRELRTLPRALAETVGKHLVAAGELVDTDPEAALKHARYAKAKAARVPIVREALGLVSYHAGNWAEALSELRAVRRMTRTDSHIAVIADAERALGRPERALDLAKEAKAQQLPRDVEIELRIVAAGARRDLGQLDAAVVSLQGPDLNPAKREPWSARLFYAYADNLAAADRRGEAVKWFLHAAEADEDEETDAAERAAELSDA